MEPEVSFLVYWDLKRNKKCPFLAGQKASRPENGKSVIILNRVTGRFSQAYPFFQGYMDFNTGIRAYIVRSAAIVAGYRVLKIDLKDSNSSGELNDDAWYIGLRLTF